MSDNGSPEDALQRVRDGFAAAAEEAEEMSEAARQEVTDAIDELEERISELRDEE